MDNIYYPNIKRSMNYLIFISHIFALVFSADKEIPYTMNNNNIIEFNSSYMINKITFARTGNSLYNYLLGIFEASNFITFSDALPIAIIKEEHLQNSNDNEISLDINVPNPYKYIKYNPPKKGTLYIKDIKIIGHEYSENENLKKKQLFRITNLPLMIINTENSVEPNTRDYYINSQIIIIKSKKIDINESASIKLRGHSTAIAPKKPYKIKFGKKQKLLGMSGKFKSWAILANYYDKSLIRNILAFNISEIIGLKFTPRCEPVDLILNGNFKGNYFVCDQIEVKEGRVEIEEISDDNITGGYLLEVDPRATEEEKHFITEKKLIGEIKYPDSDDITKDQEDYINQYLNILEDEIHNNSLEYIDLNSFCRYFLIQNLCGDVDYVFSSFYITKRKGDDKIYFGPVWDYDLFLDNEARLIPTNKKPKFVLDDSDSTDTSTNFIMTIFKTKNVSKEMNETLTELIKKGFYFETFKKFIDEKKELLLESANLNMLKWYNSKIGEGVKDYSDCLDIIKDYIKTRFDSLPQLLNEFDSDGGNLNNVVKENENQGFHIFGKDNNEKIFLFYFLIFLYL